MPNIISQSPLKHMIVTLWSLAPLNDICRCLYAQWALTVMPQTAGEGNGKEPIEQMALGKVGVL